MWRQAKENVYLHKIELSMDLKKKIIAVKLDELGGKNKIPFPRYSQELTNFSLPLEIAFYTWSTVAISVVCILISDCFIF